MATQSTPVITEEEYLRLERASDHKSEFINGEIFAMAGGKLRHSLITANFAGALGAKLRGGNCLVFSPDLRVRTATSGSYVYPDVSVVCGVPQVHEGAGDILINPKLVVEVLSPSTADYDHGKKFELYREIVSLEDYVLVDTGTARVEHFARQPDGSWTFREYRGIEAAVPFASLGCTVELAEVYAGVFDLPS
ncbi:MAG: Uma2 family endonuclease [Acidobacteriota bacterium]|nr:Uma2 family endonuclease [Acidobacteriota bacterium]